MHTTDLAAPLAGLLNELAYGATEGEAFVLNPGDTGLLASLERIDAVEASSTPTGGATIAAHVEHVRYGLWLMNRWARGEENPFEGADWAAAWRVQEVNDDEWRARREALKLVIDEWHRVLATPRDVQPIEVSGMLGSVIHLGYHLGAMRQISAAMRGPRA